MRRLGIPIASGAFQAAPFLPERLRTARLVQRAGDHLRFDHEGDGVCEGAADAVGAPSAQWYVVVRRASREETVPEIGPSQVDTLDMDWRGEGKPSLVLTGYTPLDRVKTRLFELSVDVDGNGIYDLRVEMRSPSTFFWVIAYQYQDAALRADSASLVDRWRQLASQIIRDFYEAEYFFNHGPEFAASQTSTMCP